MDLLHEFLLGTSSDFDVVAITEASERNNDFFKTNVVIKGYKNYFASSYTEKGGVAIYTKDNLNSYECTDLKCKIKTLNLLRLKLKTKTVKT